MSHNIVTVKGPNPKFVKICRECFMITFPYLFFDVMCSVIVRVCVLRMDVGKGKIIFKIRKIY